MRALLILFLLVATGCGGKVEDDMSFPLAPWHLWGSSKLLEVPLVSLAPPTVVSGQLAKINYARPDTWSFLLAAKILSVPQLGVGEFAQVRVRFDLDVGIGRSRLEFRDALPTGAVDLFTELTFVVDQAGQNAMPRGKWVTQVRTPAIDDNAPTVFETISALPAQDIQCSADVTATSSSGVFAAPVQVEVHSYFAPRSHIRPEWFSDVEGDSGRFRGKETGGT